MKKYPCPMSENGCEYGGNKTYNHGFVSGSGSYCRHPTQKRFIYGMFGDIECPKKMAPKR